MGKITRFVILGFIFVIALNPVISFSADIYIGDKTTFLNSGKSATENYRLLVSQRKDVVREAFRHLGQPYVWAATGPDKFDCSGLVQHVYGKFGVNLPRVSIEQGLSGVLINRSLRNLRMGDLLYFKVNTGRYPHHIGIYAGKGLFIHARSSYGVTVNSLLEEPWTNSLQRVSRIFFTDIAVSSNKINSSKTQKENKESNSFSSNNNVENILMQFASQKKQIFENNLPMGWR